MKRIIIALCLLFATPVFAIKSSVEKTDIANYKIGASLQEKATKEGDCYMQVKYVFLYSPAYNAGIKKGDKIYKINGMPINETVEFYNSLAKNEKNILSLRHNFLNTAITNLFNKKTIDYEINGYNILADKHFDIWMEFCPEVCIFASFQTVQFVH